MKKLNSKQKKAHISKSKKAIKKLNKKNKQYQRQRTNRNPKFTRIKYHEQLATAPKSFCLLNNTEETLGFFSEVMKKIKKLKQNGILYFDLSNIEIVSVDAIMYLIAIISNFKRIRVMNIRCSGNMPKNQEAKNIFISAGFYKYVSSRNRIESIESGRNISITTGTSADPVLLGKVCDFVHLHCAMTRLDTKFLYPMIMELMTNTTQHAYKDKAIMMKQWFLYVENDEETIQFVFLDTGVGIPNTIKMKLLEKLYAIVNNNDAYFIASAMRGELRSETKLDYRGKGLPEIYECVCNHSISKFSVISGSGKCSVIDSEISEIPLKNQLAGTLFSWTLNKRKGEI